jgi:hypothetical protein
MVIEMKEKKQNIKKSLSCGTSYNLLEGFMELSQEDREIYLFLRGGFAAK